MLNARWLDTFTTLAETGSFTRAAERLHMTQPGVSQHVKKLEDQVGCALLSRSGKSFTLTPAGEEIYRLGRQRRIDEARVMEAVGHDNPRRGRVTIACSGSFATLLHPRLLDLAEDAPDLMIWLEATPHERLAAGVADGRFDLAVTDQYAPSPRVDAEKIGAEELRLIVPADTPPGVPDFDALEALGFIAHPDGYAHADQLLAPNYPDRYFGSDRLRLRGFVNQIGQIPAPVARGIGYTILPQSGLDAFPRRDRLRSVDLPHPAPRALFLLTRHGRVLPERTLVAAELIRTIARGLVTTARSPAGP